MQTLPNTRPHPLPTLHAPAERASRGEIADLARQLGDQPLVQALLNGYPDIAIILNIHRQIVACNRQLLQLLGAPDASLWLGKRPGELLVCLAADDGPGGCGTSNSCRSCGAVNSILEAQKTNEPARGVCQITVGAEADPKPVELEVAVEPLQIAGHALLIFTAKDISATTRRAALEQLFFHDALNTAGGIQGMADLIATDSRDSASMTSALSAAARQLVEQIRAQRDLTAAERGELQPQWSTLTVGGVLEAVRSAYVAHPVARGRRIETSCPAPRDAFESDAILLGRVLGNLIKNALEATPEGGVVTLRGDTTTDGVVFTVHNQAVIPEAVRSQVFNRSFSTKSETGRGLGAFSVRLLTTRYLGGRVSFDSRPGVGTTFQISLPRQHSPTWRPTDVNATPEAAQQSLTGFSLLLAEDDPANSKLIERYLTNAGARVTLVGDGRAAVTALEAEPDFDALLLDLDLPLLDGFAAAQQARANGYTGPIAALSAHSAASQADRCRAAGFDIQLEKPIQQKMLIERLAQLVTQRATCAS